MVFCNRAPSCNPCPFIGDKRDEESKNLLELLFLPYKRKNLFDDVENKSRATHSTLYSDDESDNGVINPNESSITSESDNIYVLHKHGRSKLPKIMKRLTPWSKKTQQSNQQKEKRPSTICFPEEKSVYSETSITVCLNTSMSSDDESTSNNVKDPLLRSEIRRYERVKANLSISLQEEEGDDMSTITASSSYSLPMKVGVNSILTPNKEYDEKDEINTELKTISTALEEEKENNIAFEKSSSFDESKSDSSTSSSPLLMDGHDDEDDDKNERSNLFNGSDETAFIKSSATLKRKPSHDSSIDEIEDESVTGSIESVFGLTSTFSTSTLGLEDFNYDDDDDLDSDLSIDSASIDSASIDSASIDSASIGSASIGSVSIDSVSIDSSPHLNEEHLSDHNDGITADISPISFFMNTNDIDDDDMNAPLLEDDSSMTKPPIESVAKTSRKKSKKLEKDTKSITPLIIDQEDSEDKDKSQDSTQVESRRRSKVKERKSFFSFLLRRNKEEKNDYSPIMEENKNTHAHLNSNALQELNSKFKIESKTCTLDTSFMEAPKQAESSNDLSLFNFESSFKETDKNKMSNVPSSFYDGRLSQKKRKFKIAETLDSISTESESASFAEESTNFSSLESSFLSDAYEVMTEKGRMTSRTEVIRSLTSSFLEDTGKPRKSKLEEQFKGLRSTKSLIAKKKLMQSHDIESMSSRSSLRFSVQHKSEDDTKSISSVSSLCAETDAPIILDPLARPSKRMKKANSDRIIDDGDVWIEKILMHKKTGKKRSFFVSVRTGERKPDEPPTGAGKVIFSDKGYALNLSRKLNRKSLRETKGDSKVWVEKIYVHKKTNETRSFFCSNESPIRFADEPPTGASKVIFVDRGYAPIRPKKLNRKSVRMTKGDMNVWVEKIYVHKKTNERRSFFCSNGSTVRFADEPPTGASKVIFKD